MTDALGLLALLAFAAALLIGLLTAVLVHQARRPPRRTAAWAIARNRPCDPDDLGLPHESWTLHRPDGAALPVWEIDLGPSALTVVLLHGWGQSRIQLLDRLEQWRPWCGRAVLYDLRGHGDAEGGPSRLGSGEEHDLLALLDRLGEGPVVLAGHSMGAVIALRAAGRPGPHAGRIRAVIAHGCYDGFRESLEGRLRAAGLPRWPMTILASAWLALRGLRQEPTSAAAARVTCPILLVHGADDQICPPAHAERIARAAALATMHLVEGAGHGDGHLVDPAGCSAALAALLRDQRAPAPAGTG